MRTKNKGFTLIELLAVIVILGLLMAIAIPSVTKYITESRKKTLTTTLGNYIGALVNEVNDLSYTFTGNNTIYAVPIECIALERGGTNPFGQWYQANDAYFAYVLIQYDDDNSKYVYGFTFKDSAGYGLYPTIQAKIKEKGSQIKTGYDLSKPETGDITSVTTLTRWQESGFEVDATTNLVVLEAESEDVIGDGKETCTLMQKGSNYAQVEEEKAIAKEEASKDYTLMATTSSSTTAFWKYREQIKNITFEDIINIPNDAFKSWDVSATGNGKVMAYITPNSSDSSYYDLYIQGDGELYANPNSSYLFYNFKYVDSINNIEILDTSKVTNMSYMFSATGYSSTVFTLDLGDKFNTSNVTNMYMTFALTGYSSPIFKLDLGNKFDTSKVTNMYMLFSRTGYSSEVFTLDLGDKFNTSNVTIMQAMFYRTGYNSKILTLDLGDKFDTSKVSKMDGLFQGAGYSSTKFTLDLGDKFDTSNVTDMHQMFWEAGYSSEVFALDLGDKFDTSKVTNMSSMFNKVAYNSKKFTLDLGDKFDTSNVTDMNAMFSEAGYSSSIFKLDCSSWNVDKVKNYAGFNYGVTSKVTAPTWVN